MDIPSRLDRLQIALDCTQAELAAHLGIGRAMFHYLRKGERNASRKLVSRLETAEVEAGIRNPKPDFAVRDGKPKDHYPTEIEENAEWLAEGLPPDLAAKLASATEPFRQIQAQIQAATEPLRRAQSDIIAALQSPPFSLLELQERMQAANAWPASATDGKLTPGELWAKYAPNR